jgi:uncharacterized membrane protein YheB (UPF0754 family)
MPVFALFDTQIDRLQDHPWVYVAMPLIAALIGYITKLAALRMMFEPIEFKGVGKVGWQGIIPKRAAKMASIAVETMTRELLSVREIIDRLDAERMAKEIEGPLLASVEKVARRVLEEHEPELWESLPESGRTLIINRVKGDAPIVVREMLDDLKTNIEEVFDLKHMVVSSLVRDKRLLNRLFREVGDKEFRFIAHSGIYFGFVIGLVQAATYLFVEQWWVLPAFGLFVGYSTDWLALKMLFYPKEPKRILGITFHGMFLRRQQEVSRDYGELIAQEILTPANLFEALLHGPASDRMFSLVYSHVHTVVDRQSGVARPLLVAAVGSHKYEQMKREVARQLMAELPDTMQHAEQYTAQAMDIRGTIVAKMETLTPRQFEGILHPAFEADEWILITVGAALGFIVGLSQDVFLVPLFKGELF